MAGLWETYPFLASLSTAGTKSSTELFHNEVDDHIFASAPITIVDGIATLYSDGTNLFRTKLVIAHESFASGDVEALGRHEPQNWYSWYIVGGPLVFRLRSKRTIPPEHKLWVTTEKVGGGVAENVRGGCELFMVRHQ